MTGLVRYFREEGGASAAEYALILALIALVIIASVLSFGQNLSNVFGNEAWSFSTL
jgi:Flp pilus assembly pilin Flp